jgi:putative membrane protein
MQFLFIKAIHIISVISWMAALLYLPRLFVYHSSNGKNEEIHKMFCLMEKKLIKIIMRPAMIITIITGVAILHIDISYMDFWWMHIKLVCVVMLIITHRYFISLHNAFVSENNQKDHRFFRKINELPTVLMILIVFLIVLKP